MPENMIVFGEIGLSGEVRPVGQAEARLKEAEKLGFGAALTPAKSRKKGGKPGAQALQVTDITPSRGLVDMFGEANLKVRAVGE